MPLPPITRFSSLATNPSATNNNNGLYAPPLNTTQIAAIPANTKVNGGIWYNTDVGQLEAIVQNKVQPVPVGIGGGNVVGPGLSTIDNIATFGNITGTLIKDSNISIDNLVSGSGKGTTTIGDIAIFADVDGKSILDGGVLAADIVTNTTGSTTNNIAIFSDNTGKAIEDSGVSIAKVPLAAPLLRFADALEAPSVTVNEIGNLGHIRFINDVSSIYVDTLTSVRFFPYNTQVCSVFTSEIGSLGLSTSESALLEIHSDSGALLLSRLTTAERTALQMVSGIDGTNGMLLFNTDTTTFNGYDGTNWRTMPLLNTDGTLTVADPVVKTNAATKAYVDAAVSGIPTATITLTGNVTGSGIVTSPITTTLNMTLDQIKAPVASLNLNSHKITNLLDPTLVQDAATKNYVDTRTITLSGAVTGSGALGTTIATTLTNINTSQITNFNAAVTAFRLDQFAAPTSSLNLNSQKIINLLDPTLAQDAATKNYVDNAIAVPAAAKFIIQTANASVPNAQVLGALTTGLLKNTTSTGILSTAVAGTDYYSPGFPTRILDNGVNNFFIGTNAGNLTVTGTFNTGVGVTSLNSLMAGAQNSAFGYQTLNSNTTGSFNCAFGTRSLISNVTNSNNAAFGHQSLFSNTSDGNAAFGYLSLRSNTTGNQNAAFGTQSLSANIIGSNNSAFGNLSGVNYTNYTNCAFFGFAADATINNLTNAVAIGYQASVGASNSMVLGGFGANQLSVGIGLTPNAQFQLPTIHANRKIVLFETANNDHQVIGLGTAANTFRFQLDSITSSAYTFNAATSSSASNELMRLTGAGDLLIGTTLENARIHVRGGVQNVAGEETCIRAQVSSGLITAAKLELIAGSTWELRSESVTSSFSIYNRTAGTYGFVLGAGVGTTFSVAKQASVTYYGKAATNTTTSATAGAFVPLAWPAAISSTLTNYTYSTLPNSRLTYTPSVLVVPTVTQLLNITITAGHGSATQGEIVIFAIYKNGLLIATARDTVTSVSGVIGIIFTVKTVPLTVETTVTSGDYFEIFVTNSVVSRTLIITDFSFSISST